MIENVQENEVVKINLYDYSIEDYYNVCNGYLNQLNQWDDGLYFIRVLEDHEIINFISYKLNDNIRCIYFRCSFFSIDLIDMFINKLKLNIKDNEYVCVYDDLFKGNLMISKDEIIGDDNIKVTFIDLF